MFLPSCKLFENLHFRLCGVHQKGDEAAAAWLPKHQEGGGDTGTA